MCLVVTLGIAVVLAQGVAGQQRWSRLAPFPEPSEELYGVANNGKMYVLGGLGMRTGMVYEYDPASDAWTKKKPMPIPTHHQAMVAYGGKIYMFGGLRYRRRRVPLAAEAVPGCRLIMLGNTIPATDTWRPLAPLPGSGVLRSLPKSTARCTSSVVPPLTRHRRMSALAATAPQWF
jgi:hypothetical protein